MGCPQNQLQITFKLCRTFYNAPEGQTPEQGQGRIGYVCIFQALISSGGVLIYFNSFQVSSSGPRHIQCEWFLYTGSSPTPGPGHNQCE